MISVNVILLVQHFEIRCICTIGRTDVDIRSAGHMQHVKCGVQSIGISKVNRNANANMRPSKDQHSSAESLLKVIRVEVFLNISEDLKHLALDQILFAK